MIYQSSSNEHVMAHSPQSCNQEDQLEANQYTVKLRKGAITQSISRVSCQFYE